MGFLKKNTFKAFCQGEVVPLEEVQDEMFSSRMMGDGLAIMPSDNHVYSPIAGEVSMVFPTYHAIGIKTKEGLDVIIHVGIDTVKLKGEGFKVFVEEKQKVKQGDLLLTADFDFIKEKGYDITTICIISNPLEVKLEMLYKKKSVDLKDDLFRVRK